MLMPKKVKYRKQQRGRMCGKAWRGGELSFGDFGLKVMEPGWITDRQIEASRVAMTRFVKRGGKIWIRLFPDKPVTKKPAETRMGKGKGAPDHWVAVVRPGKILFEMEGVSAADASEAMRLASHKLRPAHQVRAPRRLGVGTNARVARMNESEKIRNLTEVELAHQQRELADQLFKLKFQMKMGQTESLKKIRDLRKDIARIKTIEREKQIAGGNGQRRVAAEASRRLKAVASKALPHRRRRRPRRRRLQRRRSKPGRDNDNATRREAGRRKTLIGEVVSTKMAKTIVVEVRPPEGAPVLSARGDAQQEVLRARRERDGARGRFREDRRDPSAVEAEALAVEGNRAARAASGEAAVAEAAARQAQRTRQVRRP